MQEGSIYDDPVVYDHIHNTAWLNDIQFYIEQVKKDRGPVLELGCGTGRVSIPIAEQRHCVTGIDIDKRMLNRAREKAEEKHLDIDWILGDIRNFDLGRQFGTIIYPANSIAHLLDIDSIEGCLACIRKHLSENGLFILHMFTPGLKILSRDHDKRYPVSEYDDPHGRGHVVVTETTIYDNARQVNDVKWYYLYEQTGEEEIKKFSMRIYYPQELDALLRYNGFEIVAKYGAFDGRPYDSSSPFQIPVCKKK